MAFAALPSFAVTDVLFLVDSTGSMNGLSNFKTAFNGIIDAIETDSCPETIMYGLADYKNYADGGKYAAYGVNLDQPFTPSSQDVKSAINGLMAGGGGDPEESQLKAMASIVNNWLTSSGDLGFSGRPGAQRILIWAGDIHGHIAGDEPEADGPPPAGYYPTLDAVINALTTEGIIVFALNPSDNNSGLNTPYAGKNNHTPPARQQASEITTATGGLLFNNAGSGSSAIEDAIVDAIICFEFIKDDDLDDEDPDDCRENGQEIEYTISWTNTSGQALTDAWILDKLPTGVSYPISYTLDPNTWEMIPSDLSYNPATHEYVWYIGAIPNGASGSVSLTVIVNSNAVPGMNLINTAELYDGESLVTTATQKTLICCPPNPPSTIYVDKFATGARSGLDWRNAYNSLDDALTQARESVCVTDFTILVAQGTYAPQNATNGFVLPSGCSVIGGYPTGGGQYSSPKKYETILTGLIDEDEFPDATKVVTMGDGSLLDGVTVTKADFQGYGVYGNGVSFTLSHCIVKENLGYGIYSTNCDAEIRWTTVSSNGWDGLYHEGEGNDLEVDTSWLLRNGTYGIRCVSSTPTIRNSIVSESSMTEQGRQAIHIKNPKYQPKLYNLTVANNRAAGLHFEDDGDADGDPNNPDYPDLQNSILFFNGGDSQISGFNPDLYANFCCIQDCNTLGTTNFPDSPGFAYQVLDPNGVPSGLPDPNNYHLAPNSVCIDRVPANPAMGYEFQTDYDGELRLFGDYVDVGADEVYNCYDEYVSEADVHNDLDWDADGIVNLVEFNAFSRAWLSRSPDEYTDPNLIDPNAIANWNPKCNLADTGTSQYVIDLADLMNFVEDTPWLWIACWKLPEINAMTTMMAGGGEGQMQSLEAGFMETEALQAIPEPEMIQPEATVEEQIFQLQDAIVFLEQIWLEEPDLQQEISAEDWQAFLDAIYQNLVALQTGTIQIE
jgi:uncharacterized repeat protein (TIGR01451 family)